MDQENKTTVEQPIRKVFHKAHQLAGIPQVIQKNISLKGNTLTVAGDKFSLDQYNKIYIGGVGIAAYKMAENLLNIMGEKVFQGVILVPPGMGGNLGKIKVCEVTSPLVDQRSYKGLRNLIYIMENAGEDDLLILFFSKGTTEFLEMLHPGISFDDYNILMKKLVMAGAATEEINSVRMHLSSIKGGQLLDRIKPSTAIVLILSDRPGGDIYRTYLAPTYFDPTTFAYCRNVLIRYKLPMKVPPGILNHFNRGLQKKVPETVKPGDSRLAKIYNFVIHDCSTFAADALTAAEDMNISGSILSTHLEGNAQQLGKFFGAILLDITEFGIPLEPPCTLIASGRLENSEEQRLERCCQVALATARSISRIDNARFLAATSFQFEEIGEVGCTVDGNTALKLSKAGVDPSHLIDTGQVTKVFREQGLLFKSRFCGNDCGDLFVMMA